MPSNSPTPKKKHSQATAGSLFIVSTPIGNLADITLRALTILSNADLIAAEDTRHTRRLLKAHHLYKRLISYHEHNEQARTPELIQRLQAGNNLALVTNAGTPMVSDPGYRLVQAAVKHHIKVVPIPGASAAVTALCAAGLPTDTFTFVGFPARKKAKRLNQLQQLASLPHTLIFFQSPRRLLSFLQELIEILGDRNAMLGREMTKQYEEFMRGRLSDILYTMNNREQIKGECTLVVSAVGESTQQAAASTAALRSTLEQALAQQEQPLTKIAKTIALRFGVPKQEVYALALRIQKNSSWKKNKRGRRL